MALNYSSATKKIDSTQDRNNLPKECLFLLGDYNNTARLIDLFHILVTDALSESDIKAVDSIDHLDDNRKIINTDQVLDKLINSDQFKEWFEGDPGYIGDEESWEVTNTDAYLNKLLKSNNPQYHTQVDINGVSANGYEQFKYLICQLLGIDYSSLVLVDNNECINFNNDVVTFGTVTGNLTYVEG